MYSQCPECLTRFRVTAAALRVAHGTVRCGRCGSAFDALQRLTDTVPDDGESSPSPSMLGSTIAAFDAPGRTGTGGGAAPGAEGGDAEVATEFHFSADDIEQVFIDARDWQKRFPRASERTATQDTAGAGDLSANDAGDADEAPRAASARSVAEDLDASTMTPPTGAPVVFVHEPEAIEDITLEGERVVIEGLPEFDEELREIVDDTGEPVDDEALRDAVRLPGGQPPPADPDPTDQFEVLRGEPDLEASVTLPVETSDARPVPVDGQRDARAAGTAARGEPATPVPTPPPIAPFRLRRHAGAVEETPGDGGDGSAGEDRRGSAVAWGIGVLVLAIALGAQLMHHFRQDLARDASVGPVIRGVYARLGRPLAPNWDLAAFEVRQWGASQAAPSADGEMTVRASLRNGAGFAQPLPLLRLELEDRFGGTVARRDFEPAEYLNDSAQASRLLAPGARTEAELDVVAAGTDAVGYRLDVCMREEIGTLRCAQSPPEASGSR
ncbi:MAG TPA: DUF3426 domain-containing protein [Steroidobacteraceae bacterium]|nr:DUF3426 domain-containing protein [Steroidobacteraceae bacterium]